MKCTKNMDCVKLILLSCICMSVWALKENISRVFGNQVAKSIVTSFFTHIFVHPCPAWTERTFLQLQCNIIKLSVPANLFKIF